MSGVNHYCSICGKTEFIASDDKWLEQKNNKWTKVKTEQKGYGSVFDGDVIQFEICQTCMVQIVNKEGS